MSQILFSTRTMTVLLFLFAVVMGVATFVESYYGTHTARAWIYNSRWFELIMLLLVLNFAGNIKRYRLYQWKKLPTLLLHLSFVVIFVGAAVTRYFSFEGMMRIQEGETQTRILSSQSFIKVAIADEKGNALQYYPEKATVLSPYHVKFNERYQYQDKVVTLEVLDYIDPKYPRGYQALQVVTAMGGDASERKTETLLRGEVITFNGQKLGFESTDQTIMNVVERGDSLYLKSPYDFAYFDMINNQDGGVKAGEETPLRQILYTTDKARFVVQQSVGTSLVVAQLTSGNEQKKVVFEGQQGDDHFHGNLTFNGMHIQLGYGSSLDPKYQTPFKVKLNDFQLENYPGSNMPSSYASEVEIIDEQTKFPFRIYMNNVLDYKGYRFFQASYDQDLKGTVLSVNADYWGTLISYIGYFLMSLSMVLTLFWRGSHFMKLISILKRTRAKQFLVLLVLSSSIPLMAQTSPGTDTLENHQGHAQESLHNYMNQPIRFDKAHMEKFATLLVQDQEGRIKPVDTYAREIVTKILGKTQFEEFNYLELYLSMTLETSRWFDKRIINVGEKGGQQLFELANAQEEKGKWYTSWREVLRDTLLVKSYEEALAVRPASQNEYQKELVKLIERLSILEGMMKGSYFWVVPDLESQNNDWNSWADRSEKIFEKGQVYVSDYFNAIIQSRVEGNWKKANASLQAMHDFQQTEDASLLPSEEKVAWEIAYNKLNIFLYAALGYGLFGLLLLVLAFMQTQRHKTTWIRSIGNILSAILVVLFLFQAFGLGLRWYISGHAPWSNGYEAIVLVSWFTVLSAVLFGLRSYFVLSTATLMATMLLLVSQLSLYSPQVTNLMPVLKSYWLMIHVAIITFSYGPFGLAFILGVVNLILMGIQTQENRKRIKRKIKELSVISEMALTLGLYTLSIGTFLGGVWANESWGRYWSWDPKETWAFISVFVYAVVLHMRLVPGLRGKFTFNLMAILAFGSILMTFLGVNYFLSGMHSYGAGDPIPVAIWLVPSLVVIGVLSVRAYYKESSLKKE